MLLLPTIAIVRAQGNDPLLARDWSLVNDYIIQLQRANVERLGVTAFDLVISDIAIAGGSRERIEALRQSAGGSKLIVAYMSIGQAARFQYYWQPEWRREANTWPEWAVEFDATWANDVWVQYWHPGWQEIILTGADAYIDRIIDQGFDGVLLDRVDAAWYFESQGRETAYQEMADFVTAIAAHARQRSPGFGIFTINGEDIGLRFREQGYLDVVTGVLVEDLYYGYPTDNTASPSDWTAEREAMLDQWVTQDRLVLTVDYARFDEQIDEAYARSAARGYIPYVSSRSLSRLFIHENHEPD
jgi:cysteinyl-tRNA synthetase